VFFFTVRIEVCVSVEQSDDPGATARTMPATI